MEVGIMGLAASGKTTLFSLLTGLDPTAGGGRRDVSQIGIASLPNEPSNNSAYYSADCLTVE